MTYRDMIYNAICNYGIQELASADIEFEYDYNDYQDARATLDDPCIEDVLMRILEQGKTWEFVDHNQSEMFPVTLETMTQNLKNTLPKDIRHEYEQGQDDAVTSYRLLQYAIFAEEIYC